MTRRLIVLVVVGATVALAGCANDPSLDPVSVVDGVAAAVVPEDAEVVTDVECDELDDATIAQAVTCTAVIHGRPITVDLNIDDDGLVAAVVREELLDLSEVEMAASDRLGTDLGTPVTVQCPGTVVVNTPGVEVECTGTSGDRERDLIVEVLADGTWTIAFAPLAD